MGLLPFKVILAFAGSLRKLFASAGNLEFAKSWCAFTQFLAANLLLKSFF